MGPIEVTGDNYTLVVALCEIPVVVCGATVGSAKGRRLLHQATELGDALGDDVLVATFDIQAHKSIADGLGIKGAAGVVIVRDGYVIDRKTADFSGTKALEEYVRSAVARTDPPEEPKKPRKHHWWNRR